MRYRVVGQRGGKPYKSKLFPTEAAAVRHGYKLTYRADGNTKRTGKAKLTSWFVREAG